MRLVKAILVIAVTLLYFASISTATGSVGTNCLNVNCYAPNDCCIWKPPGASSNVGNCYNSAVFSCSPDESRTGDKCLCPTTAPSCCNGACFSPATMDCVNNTGNNGPTCLCRTNQGCCNGNCFDLSIYVCVPADNKPGKNCLCQKNIANICHFNYATQEQTCYNNDTQKVCNDRIVPIDAGTIDVDVTSSAGPTCGSTVLTCAATGTVGSPSYQWTTTGGSIPAGTSTLPIITVTASGVYTCTVTDSNNCPGSDSITVSSASPLSASIQATPASGAGCNTVTLTCIPQNAVGSVAYAWTNGLGGSVGSTQTIAVSSSDTYTCTITATNGGQQCTASASQPVTVSHLVTSITAPSTVSCNGAPIPLTCVGSNGAGVVQYSWTGTGTFTGNPNSNTILATSSGTFTCTATDGLCTNAANQAVIIQNQVASITTSPSPPNTCNGSPVTLTCSSSVPGSSYLWTDSGNTVVSTSAVYVTSTPGTYTCTTINGPCSDTESVTVTGVGCVCTAFTLLIAPEYGSTENTGAWARLTFTFTQSGPNTVLSLLIENETDGSKGLGATVATLVGVAFDSPGNLAVSSYDPNSTSFTTLWQPADLPPYPDFDIGVSPPRMSFGGGNPMAGITAGNSITVLFTFNGQTAATLATSFLTGFQTNTLRAAGRFQQVNAGGGSDKVLQGGVQCV